MEQSSKPENWALSTLGELAGKGQYGWTTKASASGDIKFLRTTDITKGAINWSTVPFCLQEPEDPKKYLLEKGDILISRAGSVGFSVLMDENIQNSVFASYLIRYRPLKGVCCNAFLKHYLSSQEYWRHIELSSSGIALANVNAKNLSCLQIPLPPLEEQYRIADKLDTTLAAVETCKQKLNNAAETIQRFRQSVLAAAVSGELTREWREERGVSKDSWKNLKLRDIGEFGRGKSKHRPRNDPRLFGGDYPFIQTGEVAKSEELITEHKQTLSEFGLKQSKLWPAGTLCITIAANIADTAILSYPACFPDSVVGFIANQQKVKTKYIKWLIESIASDLERFAPATAQKNINLSILDEIELAIPSLDEQDAAVMQGQELLDYANGIESKITKVLEQTTHIEKSMLAKAFRGELVPQDPNDEPASVLLERIKNHRESEAAAQKPAKRGRKKKADPAQLDIPAGIAENHLAKVLEECGALSERALLAASELEPAVFQLQLTKELKAGGLKQVDIDGEAAYADAAWEEEK